MFRVAAGMFVGDTLCVGSPRVSPTVVYFLGIPVWYITSLHGLWAVIATLIVDAHECYIYIHTYIHMSEHATFSRQFWCRHNFVWCLVTLLAMRMSSLNQKTCVVCDQQISSLGCRLCHNQVNIRNCSITLPHSVVFLYLSLVRTSNPWLTSNMFDQKRDFCLLTHVHTRLVPSRLRLH